MRVLLIDNQENLDKAWKSASKWIEKAKNRANSKYPLEDIYQDILHGKKMLVKLVEGKKFVWLILGVEMNSHCRVSKILYCAGVGLLEMLDEVVAFCEAYAITNGAKSITLSGRKGWERAMQKVGYKYCSITLGKEL